MVDASKFSTTGNVAQKTDDFQRSSPRFRGAPEYFLGLPRGLHVAIEEKSHIT